ncbi:MAG: hypothetical protein GY856_30250 [bacterium]|nr:hypothetical protein [bacterium]
MGLDAIRSFAAKIRFPEAPPRVAVWDFRAWFTQAGPEWVEVMARTLIGCVLTGEETILITQLLPGRNAKEHSGPGRCRLTEKTCWNLRVSVPDTDCRRIPAVCSRRNVSIPWTIRFDDTLPAESDGASFPFCPQRDWFKSSVCAFETHQGRPAWLDAKGNHWACPGTGWGHHWDVYLDLHLRDRYGLGQLNIVRWGSSPGAGVVGDLHHVPREKQPRLKIRTGWTC